MIYTARAPSWQKNVADFRTDFITDGYATSGVDQFHTFKATDPEQFI